jgi:hypothetical protein
MVTSWGKFMVDDGLLKEAERLVEGENYEASGPQFDDKS